MSRRESKIPKSASKPVASGPIALETPAASKKVSLSTPSRPQISTPLTPHIRTRRVAPKTFQLTLSSTPVEGKHNEKQSVRGTTTKHRQGPYLHVHVGDACIVGSLVHQLCCGHKVITPAPENCQSNCQRPLRSAIAGYANQRNTKFPFVCPACVEMQIQNNQFAKRTLFMQQFANHDSFIANLPDQWRESQLQYWERVWENDMHKERTEFAKLGKPCRDVNGAQFLPLPSGVNIKLESRQGVPWPPRKRPKQNRSPDWRIREEDNREDVQQRGAAGAVDVRSKTGSEADE